MRSQSGSQHNINKVWLEEVIIRVTKTWCYRDSVKTVEPICAISAVLQFHSVGAVVLRSTLNFFFVQNGSVTLSCSPCKKIYKVKLQQRTVLSSNSVG